MGVTDSKMKVDHIFHNTFDNRKEKLRVCTNQENCFNHVAHKNNYSTGICGITRDESKKNKKYRARIYINKKGIHLGYFETLDEAIMARNEAEKKYFGEYRIAEEGNNE